MADAETIDDEPLGMAVEELVFFTVIPICALLTLEAVRLLLPRLGLQGAKPKAGR